MESDRTWRVVRGTFDPAMHMALDEVITDRVATGEAPPTLRFWEWTTPAVVIGRFQSVHDEVNLEQADRYDVEVVRRSTGGGAMFTQPQRVVTYSLSMPEHYVETDDITASYRELEDWSLAALNSLGIPAEHEPVNDIVYGHQKIGGSAQARRNGTVLHHTMLSYDLEIAAMLDVMRIWEEKLSDKAIESAAKRVAPIRTVRDVSRDTVVDALIATFAERHLVEEGELTEDELQDARELVDEKYGTDVWTYVVDREIERHPERE